MDLFWRENIVIGLLLVELVLCRPLKRRRFWWLSWIGFAILMFLVAHFFNGNWVWEDDQRIQLGAMLQTIPARIIIFGLSYGQMMCCYKLPVWNGLYYLAIAMSLQHTQFSIYKIIEEVLRLTHIANAVGVESILLDLAVLMVYLLLMGFIISEKKQIEIRGENRFVVILAMVLFMASETISMYLYVKDPMVNFGWTLVTTRTQDIFYNIVMLTMLYNLIGRKALEVENDALSALSRQRSNQYIFTQELINTINIKSHDLKKQVRYLKNNTEGTKEFLDDIESSVLLYDSIVHTKNDTLSAILTEKSMVCQKNEIPFTCIADGSGLGFIKELDIYTLFANLMDNAIEASEKVAAEDRSISLIVKQQGSFISIHQENYFKEPPQEENGIYKTLKANKDYHGFGIKSMRNIIEKYNGTLSISVDEKRFRTNILIPIP
ncbi:MAG: GHKL domain-containing protein [Lachnospiraceae bacterium]|nr:GHKL domain-containing protein [Lachnospiraceae bacterium]